MTDRNSWNMARIVSNRPLPKARKMHGPVGEKREGHVAAGAYGVPFWQVPGAKCALVDGYDVGTCKDCGYHVCSCKPKEQLAWGDGTSAPLTVQSCGCKLLAYGDIARRAIAMEHSVATMAERLGYRGWVDMEASAGMRLPCKQHKPTPASKPSPLDDLYAAQTHALLPGFTSCSKCGSLVLNKHFYSCACRYSALDGLV